MFRRLEVRRAELCLRSQTDTHMWPSLRRTVYGKSLHGWLTGNDTKIWWEGIETSLYTDKGNSPQILVYNLKDKGLFPRPTDVSKDIKRKLPKTRSDWSTVTFLLNEITIYKGFERVIWKPDNKYGGTLREKDVYFLVQILDRRTFWMVCTVVVLRRRRRTVGWGTCQTSCRKGTDLTVSWYKNGGVLHTESRTTWWRTNRRKHTSDFRRNPVANRR